MPEAALAQLKGFISLCQAQPQIIHRPELKFFKDYLESMGATLPAPAPEPKQDKTSSGEAKDEEKTAKEEPEVNLFRIYFLIFQPLKYLLHIFFEISVLLEDGCFTFQRK